MFQADLPRARSLAEIAVLAYATVLMIAVVVVLGMADGEAESWLLSGAPLLAVVLAIVSRARQMVWTALGGCLALGLLSIFSIGMLIIQIGLCLFLWWLITSRRVGRPAVIWQDLAWQTTGFAVVMLPGRGILESVASHRNATFATFTTQWWLPSGWWDRICRGPGRIAMRRYLSESSEGLRVHGSTPADVYHAGVRSDCGSSMLRLVVFAAGLLAHVPIIIGRRAGAKYPQSLDLCDLEATRSSLPRETIGA